MASNKTNTEKLKLYLLGDEVKKGFLLEEDNNGKTIMLSGAWGAGKTHFWNNEIEINNFQYKECDKSCDYEKAKWEYFEYSKGLHSKLKEKKKACIYVSLYGKDNLDSLKKEVLIKASNDKLLLDKKVSAFGFEALVSIKDRDLDIGKFLNVVKNFYNYFKNTKGKNRLDGGVICLDDFERKSKEIDLNDLFGFIAQLAIDMNCKIVIILNSDVFEGKEAEVFKRVKEKTVDKYFKFKPTIKELFNSIYSEKYSLLDEYKDDILKSIEDTEELNARIYIQVLDNCLEWKKSERDLDKNVIRVLVLGTINFVLNHIILSSPITHKVEYSFSSIGGTNTLYHILYPNFTLPNINLYKIFPAINNKKEISKYNILGNSNNKFFTKDDKYLSLSKKLQIFLSFKEGLSDSQQTDILSWLSTNSHSLDELWKYGYRLCYVFPIFITKHPKKPLHNAKSQKNLFRFSLQ